MRRPFPQVSFNMIVERIRGALRRQPFEPFAVKLVDGTTFTVEHHDWISVPPGARPRDLTFYTPMGGDEYRTHWVNLDLILEVVVPAGEAARA